MPELPELQALAEGLTAALAGRLITDARVHQHHTLKTAVPPIGDLAGRRIARIWRRGKILGVEAEGDRTLVIHPMQAGRLGVAAAPAGRPGRTAAIDLGIGEGEVLRLRELSTTRRASAHLLDAAGLAEHRPLTRLGPEPIGLDAAGWRDALTSGRGAVLHTALRDGRRVAGIGRAYASDIMPGSPRSTTTPTRASRGRPTPCSSRPSTGPASASRQTCRTASSASPRSTATTASRACGAARAWSTSRSASTTSSTARRARPAARCTATAG